MYGRDASKQCGYMGVVSRGKTELRQCRNSKVPGRQFCARHQLEERALGGK